MSSMGRVKSVLAILLVSASAGADGNDEGVSVARGVRVPTPPWPDGDVRGMENPQGVATRLRCAGNTANPRARSYELSHERAPTMPASPFGVPLVYNYLPSGGVSFTRHVFNGEDVCGEPAAQGTQMDAIGH